MDKIWKVIPFLAVLIFPPLLVNCGQSDPALTDKEVVVQAGQLDVRFSRVKPFNATYMLFGGAENNHGNAFAKITLFGLEENKAKYIYSRYPDFYKCKSAGAPMAQKETCQLDIVPADSKVLKNLKQSLAEFNKSVGNDGDRMCIRLQGEILRLTSAVVRDMDQDITKELPPAVHKEYFFVQSADLIGFQQAIIGP